MLVLTAHTQYLQPLAVKNLQSNVEFAVAVYNQPPYEEIPVSNVSNNDVPAGDINTNGISDVVGDKPAKAISFEGSRGSLPWPVTAGLIAIHFGPYTVDGIKGISDGIYINLAAGDSVKAVADGVISGVYDIGGSTAVILKHEKYYTTYNNLEGIAVNKGDTVKAGKVLGIMAGTGPGESQLLFMINDDKGTPLDPERWLKRI